MKIQPRDKRALLRAALGEIKSDLAIKNVQLVNVITGEIYPASVYVYDGFIAHVEYKAPGGEEQFAKEVVDGQEFRKGSDSKGNHHCYHGPP